MHGLGGRGGACQHEESSQEWLCRGKFGRANLKLWLESLGYVAGILGQQIACWIAGATPVLPFRFSGPQSLPCSLSPLGRGASR